MAKRSRLKRKIDRTGQAPVSFAAQVDLQCAEAEGEQLARFSILAYTGGAMEVGGFYWPLVIDLAGLNADRQQRPVLFQHDPSEIVGHTESIEVTSRTVRVSGVVSGIGGRSVEVVSLAKRGFPWQASVGATVSQLEFVEKGQQVKVNGRSFTGPLYVARKTQLKEVSFVPLGADDNTRASIAAQARRLDMQFEKWLEASGFEVDSLTDEQVQVLRAAYDAHDRKSDDSDAAPQINAAQVLDDLRKRNAEELERQRRITEVCAKYGNPVYRDGDTEIGLAAHAIANGWTVEATELHALRASRPLAPRPSVSSSVTPRTIEAALCISAGLDVESQYDEQTLDSAYRYRNRGLRWCIEQICASLGIELDSDPGSTKWIRAAFSSNELSGIIGNVANKALQRAFTAIQPTVPRIAGTANHSNFHAHTVYSLALNGELQKVGKDGELKHLSMSEESRTRQVETRGAVLGITRQDLINDDLGAFVDAATALGRKAVLSREKAVYELLNATGAGSSFFTSARGNYFSGSTSALSSTSLGTAVELFRKQTGPDGDPIMIEPRVLLVPPSLEVTARELMNSEFLVGDSSKKQPSRNIWMGAFTVVTSPWLSNTNLTGASDTAWYLLADPEDVPAIEIAYLNGQQTPVIDFFGLETDANRLGVTWRVYYDFGAALAEYRAGVKSAGA